MQPDQLFCFQPIYEYLTSAGHGDWAHDIREAVDAAIAMDQHGNLKHWIEALSQLPATTRSLDVDEGRVAVGGASSARADDLSNLLKRFHPWRKGPFRVSGIDIDTEWRSDWKWNRIAGHVEFRDRAVLDVGCGNGYFGWRMLKSGARLVVGLDPFLLYVMQHEAIRQLAPSGAPNFVVPVGDRILDREARVFDVVLSMGVLYHRTSPIEHLQSLLKVLQRGGQLVLETLVTQEAGQQILMPEGRYAKMRNVWFIPCLEMLKLWLRRTGFDRIEVCDVTPTTIEEQRSTSWMTFESLPDFLDPHDRSRTVEGYPGPVRAVLTARAAR